MSILPSSSRLSLMKHPLGWIATGFGSGLAPKAPGTIGSLFALIPWFFWMRGLPLWIYGGVIVAGFAIGIWASNWTIKQSNIQDPGFVVWDEFIGLWISLFLVPAGWVWMLAGFVLFRFFDIVKPWPVSWADQKIHGGFGVMLDDAIAGVYAFLCLQLALYFFK
ncbi:MAG: phosphatidylglycerophosphatase A [Arenimonas sp.]